MRAIAGLLLLAAMLPPLEAQRSRGRGAVQPQPVAGAAPEPVTMETVNRRWSGARCQIRIPVALPKGKGWVTSESMKTPTLPGEKDLRMRVSVSDRAALERAGYLRQNKEIRVGTAFIARGWRFKDGKRKRDLVLDLTFENLPVQAAVDFVDNDDLDNLEAVERVMRFEIFQLSAAPAGPSPPAADPPPAAASTGAPPSTAPGTGQVLRPSVRITVVSAQPAVVSPGAEVDLVVIYAVEGIPEGFMLEVRELRRLSAGETMAGNFEETVNRGPGTFTSSQKVQVPPGAQPGIYTVHVEVNAGGHRAESSAIFQVR